MKKTIIIILFFMILISCEEKTDWELENERLPGLVVEGMMTNELMAHKVKLSRPSRNLNDPPEPVTGAFVTISDQENTYLLQENSDFPGSYFTAQDVQGVIGKVYTLYLKIGESEYTANSYMVPVEPLQQIQLESCSGGNGYFHIKFDESGEPYILEVNADWSETEACTDDEPCFAKMYFYHLNSIDVNDIFKPQKETVCLPVGTRVIRKKYSLNPDYQSFIRSMLMETDWQGGIFDVEKGNVETNISGNGIGYFVAATVDIDTAFIK